MEKKILIVEDDKDIRDALKDAFTIFGYNVSTAGNGQEALDRLEDDLPHLILLDLMMPIMNGTEFRSHQMSNPRFSKIPVVVITADGNAKSKAQKIGAADGLPKPIDLPNLLSVVSKHCL